MQHTPDSSMMSGVGEPSNAADICLQSPGPVTLSEYVGLRAFSIELMRGPTLHLAQREWAFRISGSIPKQAEGRQALQYRFAGFVLDLDSIELRHGGELIELRRKVFDVLQLLVEAAPSSVEKRALLDAAWPGVVTGDESLFQAISQLRRSLTDAMSDTEIIRTVRGHGYAMAIAVACVTSEPDDATARPHRRSPRGCGTHRDVLRSQRKRRSSKCPPTSGASVNP